MTNLVLILVFLAASGVEPINRINLPPNYKPISMLPTRRILKGRLVGEARPYMVYLRPALDVDKRLIDSHWLCGGVIFHDRHILTSAACIEDVKNFYVVSGTHKWVPPEDHDNECIINGAKRAIWKCVPKSYSYDGLEFDNIRWMMSDIAIVRVEDEFNFQRKIQGCDFIPQKILINNISLALERSGTIASVAGWGTTNSFTKVDTYPIEKAENSVDLLETDVVLISKKGCRSQWEERYHDVINKQMICTKDSTDFDIGGDACADQESNCKQLEDFEDDYLEEKHFSPQRRTIIDPKAYFVHTAAHHNLRKGFDMKTGGFCENDHGGPLVVGQGKTAIVIGVMTACLTKHKSNKCFGPFLYTSVYKFRDVISFCGITIYDRRRCESVMQSTNTTFKETFFDWTHHPDGPPRLDESGKPVLRSYAQTPLYPQWSGLPIQSTKQESTNNNISLTNTAITSTFISTFSSKNTPILPSTVFRGVEEEAKIPKISDDNMVTKKLRFAIAHRRGYTMSRSSSALLRIPRSLYLKRNTFPVVDHSTKTRQTGKTKVKKLFNIIKKWQRRFQDNLDTAV